MKKIAALVAAFVAIGVLAVANADEIEANARRAFRMILSQTDANKDGIITEDEYVKQGMSLGAKKKPTAPAAKKR